VDAGHDIACPDALDSPGATFLLDVAEEWRARTDTEWVGAEEIAEQVVDQVESRGTYPMLQAWIDLMCWRAMDEDDATRFAVPVESDPTNLAKTQLWWVAALLCSAIETNDTKEA